MEDNIDVSVVIPVYNDTEGIRTTIHSLVAQSARTYDLFPVDNDSTDGTGDVIAEIADGHPELVHPCEETAIQSSYAARNTGIEHASGDILLFFDADMWAPETWIEDMVTALESNDYDYLGCNVEVVADDRPNFWERYEQSFSFPVETYLEDKHFAPTCALAVRREVFEEVGLFDERLESGGDKEFGQRVHRAGFEQGYAGDVTAYHPARDSWDALRSKALRIGRGHTQKRRYHPELGEPHPLHPINYLPPSPFRLRRRFSGQDVSLASLVGFYLLEYVLKLTQSYGTLRETLAQRRSKREEPSR
ncbi:glycosyltransferase [Natronorubrum bangense]|uniref:Sugar transferase-like protein n=2 Tax=Natronorubrum bangense TaxID=61858 RepID=L9WRM1_9EURY|nr:glycosyltransferase [Natronorubrum bangense]ELY51866.1 sugar transferase-like protein [Natronorubrum bangense JCM 10635]QCC54903.1 glycosyltransferase [Natronorubrum bangense]